MKWGMVISTTRRSTRVRLDADAREISAVCRAGLEPVVGDRVAVEEAELGTVLVEISERVRVLSRSYQKRTKTLAANLDRVFVVTAPGSLFNSIFIDRVLAVARSQDIPATLIFNKSDLSDEVFGEMKRLYLGLGYEVIETSTKVDGGLDALHAALHDDAIRLVAFCGVSGVGKSSLLNRLIPSVASRTQAVSERTGQGKQTTSQARAFPLPRGEHPPLFVVDLPGVQHFGVAGLTERQLSGVMPELARYRGECQFLDCMHIDEPGCVVSAAAESGLIAPTRLLSYFDMLDEIRREPKY